MKKFIILMSMLLFVFSLGNAATKKTPKAPKEPKIKLTKEEKSAMKELKKETKANEKILKKTESKTKREDAKFRKLMKSYELEAVITTNKGSISIFLYPEAAPLNVANFVYLAKNNFYNGLKFHRVLGNVLIQAGDPLGTGMGTTGYSIDDEIVNWLNFENEGVVAMANNGPNTNSSQFFITMASLPQLNNKYTVIGETVSRDDLSVVRVIRADDTITNIEIKGKKVNEFLNNFTDEVSQWDEILKNK